MENDAGDITLLNEVDKPQYEIEPMSKGKANELDGKTWTRYSISIWSDIKKSKEELKLKHPAMFPSDLASRLIDLFTNKEQKVVFDPFVGIGSTVLAALKKGKQGIGIELNEEFADIAKKRIENIDMFSDNSTAKIITADSREIPLLIKPSSVDLVVTSPPYWDILNRKRTADYKEIRNYGNSEGDLGCIESYSGFLEALKAIFSCVYVALKHNCYCIVIVMDIRKKDAFFPYHSDIATMMTSIGFIFDDIIIWDRRSEYNNMRPLGYPYVFRINKAHEYILIFKKK